MKPLYQTLKEKKRYLLIQIHSENSFRFSAIEKELKEKIKEFLGEFQMSKAGIIFFKETWDSKSKTFIVRVGNKQVDAFKGAITLIKNIKILAKLFTKKSHYF